MKYSGGNWMTVGSAGFSVGQVDSISLVIDTASGTPYGAYPDYGDTTKVTVMRFDGTGWIPVERTGISAGSASSVSLGIYNGARMSPALTTPTVRRRR